MTDLKKLVSEFASAFEAGKDPDPGAFLARVEPSERSELAELLDAYLDTAPTQRWDADAYANSQVKLAVDKAFENLEPQPQTWRELLPRLRSRLQVSRKQVSARLAELLGFPDEVDRVHSYYHHMENGTLPARGISDKALDALAEIYGTSREVLRSAGERLPDPGPAAGAAIFTRTALVNPEYSQDADSAGGLPSGFVGGGPAAAPAPGPKRKPDELDRLFLGDEI